MQAVLEGIKDPRISVIYGPHQNQNVAINRAVATVKTEYCSRLDSDDILAPLAVETLDDYIKANPQIGYFYSSLRVVDENGSPKGLDRRAEDFDPARLEEWFIAHHWITWKVQDLVVSSSVWEKGLPGLTDNGVNYGEDYLLALTMMLHGTKFMGIKEFLYSEREHGAGRIQTSYEPEKCEAIINGMLKRYAEMKKDMGVSLYGEDSSTTRPRLYRKQE